MSNNQPSKELLYEYACLHCNEHAIKTYLNIGLASEQGEQANECICSRNDTNKHINEFMYEYIEYAYSIFKIQN